LRISGCKRFSFDSEVISSIFRRVIEDLKKGGGGEQTGFQILLLNGDSTDVSFRINFFGGEMRKLIRSRICKSKIKGG